MKYSAKRSILYKAYGCGIETPTMQRMDNFFLTQLHRTLLIKQQQQIHNVKVQ